jgi:hypothetical protein
MINIFLPHKQPLNGPTNYTEYHSLPLFLYKMDYNQRLVGKDKDAKCCSLELASPDLKITLPTSQSHIKLALRYRIHLKPTESSKPINMTHLKESL